MESENKVLTNITSKNIDPISFFEKDADFVFIYKKTEKLASAVYLVTNLFSENEPMKWTLRRKVSDMVSFTINYKDISDSMKVDFVNAIRIKILEIVSLLEIASHGGIVSRMNFNILKQEFSYVIEALDNQKNSVKTGVDTSVLTPFFASTESGVNAHPEEGYSHTVIPESQGVVKKTFVDLKDKYVKQPKKDDFKKLGRQSIILDLIRKRKELTIKDIAEVIKDCSEKTIQRELNSLIGDGTLKRTGVRRWSKYSFV